MEAHDPVLAPWAAFYTVTGSSAAALIGLTFVVITLISDRDSEQGVSRDGISTFTTPTVVHFGTALMISAGYCAPWHSFSGPAVLLFAVGLVGVAYVLRAYLTSRQIRNDYEPDWEDYAWYTIVPAIAYVVMIVASLFFARIEKTIEYLAASCVSLLIVIGIRNSWDIVTYIAVARRNESP